MLSFVGGHGVVGPGCRMRREGTSHEGVKVFA